MGLQELNLLKTNLARIAEIENELPKCLDQIRNLETTIRNIPINLRSGLEQREKALTDEEANRKRLVELTSLLEINRTYRRDLDNYLRREIIFVVCGLLFGIIPYGLLVVNGSIQTVVEWQLANGCIGDCGPLDRLFSWVMGYIGGFLIISFVCGMVVFVFRVIFGKDPSKPQPWSPNEKNAYKYPGFSEDMIAEIRQPQLGKARIAPKSEIHTESGAKESQAIKMLEELQRLKSQYERELPALHSQISHLIPFSSRLSLDNR